MRIFVYFVLAFLIPVFSDGQELFLHNEPASSVPKGVVGVRLFGESYKEIDTQRNLFALRLMYGVTPKLSVYLTASGSNHHGENLPKDLIGHRHVGNQTVSYAQLIQKGVSYPYLFNGFHLYAKYRFLTRDGQNEHFRMAFYGEGSNVKSAHDEAEPNLLDDTKGIGGGIIATYLKNKMAVSLTTGVIIPFNHSETISSGGSLPYNLKVQYGRAIIYNLSFGYLLFPKDYKDYSQTNWNVYLEFMGKSYERARVFENGQELQAQSAYLNAGHYVEVHPGIQRIINSNLRIDFSLGFPFIRESYVHFYPVIYLGVQRYFYFKKM